MSSHHPRSGSASASASGTPAPTPSPQPPTSEETSSQPSTSSRSRGTQSQPRSQRSQRSHQSRRPGTAPPAEEQPGLEVYNPPPPPTSASPPPRQKRPGPRPGTAPEVSWSDEANVSQYTFYREPTPTPPEYSEREKADGYVGGALPRRPGRSSTIALETALSIPPPDTRRKPAGRQTVWAQKKLLFFCAAGAIILVFAIALGVGIGVGVGKKSDSAVAQSAGGSSSSSLASTTSRPTTSPTTTSSPSSSSTSSSSDSASPIPTASTDCPYINNTIYQVPGSNKKFLRLCGIDYSQGSEAVDIANKPTFSFADCMGNCAGTYGCTACAWGITSGDTGADHQCWMKSNLQTGHKADADWCFAILQQ